MGGIVLYCHPTFLSQSLFSSIKPFFVSFWSYLFTKQVCCQCQNFYFIIFFLPEIPFSFLLSVQIYHFFRGVSGHSCSTKSSVKYLLFRSTCIFTLLLQLLFITHFVLNEFYLVFFLIIMFQCFSSTHG